MIKKVSVPDIVCHCCSTRYLVDSRWLKCWKKYVGFDSWDVYGVGEEVNHPGPVDNAILFKGILY